MKLKGEIVDRLRQVLGGKTPTPRRIEKLLDEVEEQRAILSGPFEPDRQVERSQVAAEAPPQIDPPASVEASPPGSVPVPPMATEPAGEMTAEERLKGEKELLLQTIKQLEAKNAELQQPRVAADKDQAIGEGKLPVASVPAPTLGAAPLKLGPKQARIKECKCGKCTAFRVYHWYCVVCLSGPYHYQQRYPHFQKNWYAPGGVHGVSHPVCSEQCRMIYLGWIGVTPGLNDHEAPPAPLEEGVAAVPSQPRPAFDSD